MSSLNTFCDVPVSTGFDDHSATSRVSLDWVHNSGLLIHNSEASGLLVLQCDVGVISMFLNDVPVAASLASDLVLGLDWFNFVRSSAPELVVRLDSGVSLDFRHPPLSIIGASQSGPLSTAADAPSSLPLSFRGRGGAVSSRTRDAISRTPRTRGVQPPRTRGGAPRTRGVQNANDDMMLVDALDEPLPALPILPALCCDDPFVSLNINEKNSVVRFLVEEILVKSEKV
ncbi:hypothetical protein B0H12DRAFT_1074960 [Mycena haematopus]|nr:hypothetical protein B0H12DRAFT_1074960 [Mycena haematopus]